MAFDLDGTLLRGDTVCEVLAKPLGRLDEMKRFELLETEADIAQARIRMAEWYKGPGIEALRVYLRDARWAPGSQEAIRQLQSCNIVVAIASITWRFAVGHFAEQLGIEHWLGTDVADDGEIDHVWGRDKAKWLQELRSNCGVALERTAAVGDSRGDLEMLREAHLSFFVGKKPMPEVPSAIHLPEADLRVVAERIVREWTP